MKIIFLGSRGVDFKGGIEFHTHKLCQKLKDKFNVNCQAIIPHYNIGTKTSYSQVGLFTIKHKAIEKILLSLNAFIYIFLNRPHIVHIQGLNSALIIPLIRILGIKVVFTSHSRDWLFPEWSLLAKIILRIFFSISLKFSNKVVFINEFTARKYKLVNSVCIKNVTEKVDRKKLKINNDFIKNNLDVLNLKPFKYILFVGRISPVKGIEVLLKAINLLEEKVSLVLAGDIQDKIYLKKLEEISKKKDIYFLGPIDTFKLKSFYFNSALVVIPSFFEEHSMVFYEALECGARLLVSNIDVFKTIDKNRVKKFKVGDHMDLSKKISELLKKDFSPKINQHSQTDTIDYEKWTERYFQIYKELLY